MYIRNRMEDVVTLRNHICQHLMKMTSVDNWRTLLYDFVQNKVTGLYKTTYIEQYRIMRRKGIENYSFDNMDVSFIANILEYGPKITTLSKKTISALKPILGDRCIRGHSSSNEPDEELYLQALVALKNLQNFLSNTVDIEKAISDESRQQFVQKYSQDIADLKLIIYNDCIEMFQIKKDIQLILSSSNQRNTFLQVYGSYKEKANLSEENNTQLFRFVIEASNMGIKYAHTYASDYYLYCLHDLDEATHRYEMMIDSFEELSVYDAHTLTDFVNHAYMTGKEPTERMKQLIKVVKDHGFDIVETPNGIVWNKK